MGIYRIEGPRVGYPGRDTYKTGEIRIAQVYTESFPKGTVLDSYGPKLAEAKPGQIEAGYAVLGIVGFMPGQLWYLYTGDESETRQSLRNAQANAATRMGADTDYYMMSNSRIFLPHDLIERRGGIKVILSTNDDSYTCRIRYEE